jgi:hypothetical protein
MPPNLISKSLTWQIMKDELYRMKFKAADRKGGAVWLVLTAPLRPTMQDRQKEWIKRGFTIPHAGLRPSRMREARPSQHCSVVKTSARRPCQIAPLPGWPKLDQSWFKTLDKSAEDI